MTHLFRTLTWSVCFLFPLGLTTVSAQDQSSQPPAPPTAPARDLSTSELQIYRDYERFEKSLFDVAEQLRRKDPERAELLYRARSQSQEQNILSQMQTISELLRSTSATGATVDPQFGPAADHQKEVLTRMKAVLRLLQSQDERERVTAEIARIQELLKDTNKIIARQKDVRADTQRSKEPQKSRDAQQRVADEAKKLSQKIEQQDEDRTQSEQPPSSPSATPENQNSPERPSDPSDSPQDSNKSDSSESQNKKSDSKSGDPQKGQKSGEQKSGDQKPSDQQGQSSPEQSQPGQQQQGQKQDQQQKGADQQKKPQQSPPEDSRKTPGREQLEQAREEMQQAIEKLEKQEKEQAVENQDQAVNRLEELKAQLEEILRQLREDERESYLTMLEARFQNMLKRQQHINTETVRIDKIEAGSRSQQNFASQADTLRKEQDDNALEAAKALHLLKEEGSSVAFPEAVQQMHQNMLLVVSRLSRQETGSTTQVVEQLIADTLNEMIAALRDELQKQQEQKQQGQQGGQGEPQDPTLVNQIAELKLIRSLQNQINVLTQQIGTEVVTDSGRTPEQLHLLQDLRVRQERLQEATYDLSVGRNQ